MWTLGFTIKMKRLDIGDVSGQIEGIYAAHGSVTSNHTKEDNQNDHKEGCWTSKNIREGACGVWNKGEDYAVYWGWKASITLTIEFE